MKPHLLLKLCLTPLLISGVGPGCSLLSAQTPAKNSVAAVVNRRTITQAEVDAAITAQLFALQQQVYAIRKVALENLISQTLVADEARRRGISAEELRSQLLAGKVEVSAKQVDELYAENASAFAAMNPDEARLRLRLDLESQARMLNYRQALAGLKEAAQVKWLLEEPRLPALSEVGAPTVGPPDAAVTIVEFSDFQCPFCRNSQSPLKEVLKNYKASVRHVFKHRPLEIHSQAFLAAQAAFCAGRQGSFLPYHDALFSSEDLSPETLHKLASKLHLNLSDFGTCLNSDLARTTVQNDVDEARRLGIDSTPTFVINGKPFRGALSFAEFKAVVEQELKTRGQNQ